MGLRALGLDPVRMVLDVITSPDENFRRYDASRRVKLYRDDFESSLQEQIGIIFRDEAIRIRLYQLARLSGSSSLLKRVADELARPIYAKAPRRTITLPGQREASKSDQKAYSDLADTICLDAVMDLSARLLVACTSVFLVAQVIEGLQADPKATTPHLEVMTPDMVSVIHHPKAKTVSVALICDSERVIAGHCLRTYVVIDDTERWEMDSAGAMIGTPVAHGLGRKPWVELHRLHRWGHYWASSAGRDLEAATLQSMLLDCIKLKKHKSQSHIQLAYNGDSDGFVKDQTMDEESILMSQGTGTLTPIDLQADPSGILKSQDALEMKSAANYGLSMDRMNHKGGGDDDGLGERVAELTKVLAKGEGCLFDLWRAVGKASGIVELNATAKMTIDYGALQHRVDRMAQLAIFETEERLGIASPLDAIYEKNPEIESDDEAWNEFKQNLADRSLKIQMLRELNMTATASPDMPGQNAQQNGALGPQVRDGNMTKTEAALVAEAGSDGGPSEPA